ncbi:MAG: hypothetical protein QXO07_01325 [Candidatus Aenigmatarchaeota archaeon]
MNREDITIIESLEEAEYILSSFKKSNLKEIVLDVSNMEANNINYLISMIENNNLSFDIIRFNNFVFFKVKK